LILPDNNNTQPLVSIALCTYNGAEFIREQLDSIINQTYPNLEIIVCDDASSDNTAGQITEYMKKEPRIKLFINEINLGYNKNFEKAFAFCSGDYIAISDQDDIWEANKIELMMKNWPAGSLFVYSLSGNFTDSELAGRMAAPEIRYTDIDDIYKLVFNSPVHGHASMFKKELLNFCTPFPENIFYDWWMSMHAASFGIIGCIPHTLTWHRVHEKNSSRTLMAIENKEEKDRQLRNQMVHFIETFCRFTNASTEKKKSLLEYSGILKTMNGRSFNFSMFYYVLKKRRQIFHYKKNGALVFFSHLKHAFLMARRGLL
jgi:glycosyltransferase involved in cell wall biosynthesis